MHLSPPFPIPHEPGAVSTPSLYYVQTLQNKGSRHECGESVARWKAFTGQMVRWG